MSNEEKKFNSGLAKKLSDEGTLSVIDAERSAQQLLSKTTLTGLARRLFEDGLLNEKEADDAFRESLKERRTFVSHLVAKKLVNSKEVAHSASKEFGVPLVDIESIALNSDLIKKIGESILKAYKVLPLYERGARKLYVAVSDPTNLPALDALKFHTKMNVEPILAEEDKLLKLIEKSLEVFDTSMAELNLEDGLLDAEIVDGDQKEGEEGEEEKKEEAPIVKFVNKMLFDAIKIKASDLHFEPYEKEYRVRFRVDGILKVVSKPPLALNKKIAARIKVMSRLDVSEKRVPQDGRIKLKISRDKSMDFRVSTCPTLFGEKIVMRILDSSAANLNIDILGYEEEMPGFRQGNQKGLYLKALDNPYGMVLVTGPTGSGKTVSLYTGVNILNKEGVNISTAEDPVEINLPGVNQVQIDEKTGMTFPRALKAFLRQDPDIILVGEIRDLVTGSIAIKAASTGHMVLSTLHTNDAPQTLTRMIDMGIPPFAIATSVNLIMAQRLCRRLCNCKVEITIPRETLLREGFSKEEISGNPEKDILPLKLYGPGPAPGKSCDRCENMGYKGRVGIYQVMPISDAMRRLIMEGRNAVDLADQAQREGIPDLRQSGLKKVRDGFTSLAEINRVILKEDVEEDVVVTGEEKASPSKEKEEVHTD